MNTKVFFRKTTLVDYPQKVAAALFFPFCNMHCPWCHNGDLILGRGESLITVGEALAHIKKRVKLLDGVVLSGGEPTLYKGLYALIKQIKSLGISVKLDTNGSKPELLAALLESDSAPDDVAMDLKFSPKKYGEIAGGAVGEGVLENGAALHNAAGCSAAGCSVQKSAEILRKAHDAGKIKLEFRSLVLPRGMWTEDDVLELAALSGGAPWNIRGFAPGSCLDARWNEEPATTPFELERFNQLAKNAAKIIE